MTLEKTITRYCWVLYGQYCTENGWKRHLRTELLTVVKGDVAGNH